MHITSAGVIFTELRIFKDFQTSRQIARMKEFKLQISIW